MGAMGIAVVVEKTKVIICEKGPIGSGVTATGS